MASIIAVDISRPGSATLAQLIADRARVRAGVAKLGETFNSKFMPQAGGVELSAQQVIVQTLTPFATSSDFAAVYFPSGAAPVRLGGAAPKGTTRVAVATSDTNFELILLVRSDGDKGAIPAVPAVSSKREMMSITLPRNRADLLSGANYTEEIANDILAIFGHPAGGTNVETARKYVLGTITFRRCR